jgi:GNAT superfamily N-acetyltransferase
MGAPKSKALQHFNLSARPMEDTDLARLHELTVGVGWPHRPEDLRLLIDVGRGYVACDEIGRVVGSGMWFGMGDDFATFGMLITSPRMQSQGAGRWLMELLMADAGDRRKFLNATSPGLRLYEQLGFVPAGTAYQWQGIAVSPGPVAPPAEMALREVSVADLDAICSLDQAAMNADRRPLLERLLQVSNGHILECNGTPVGFSLSRTFGRGHVIGPMVAPDDAAAITLVAPHVSRLAGSFLRIDSAETGVEFTDFLDTVGLIRVETMTRMRIGAAPMGSPAARSYAFVNQSLS